MIMQIYNEKEQVDKKLKNIQFKEIKTPENEMLQLSPVLTEKKN